MASLTSAAVAVASPPRNERLELHIRCVANDDNVTVCLILPDGSTVSLNRSSDDEMASTLRRLSLTIQKRRRIAAGGKSGAAKTKAGAAAGGKANNGGGNKRSKGVNCGAGGAAAAAAAAASVTAGLFERGTEQPIEIGGVLNRDGWTRLCCGEEEEGIAGVNGSGRDGIKGAASHAGLCDGDSSSSNNNNNNNDNNSSSRKNGPAVVRIGPVKVAAAAAAGAAVAAASGGEFLEMDVVVNPPAVTSLECPIAVPMAGFSIVAQAEAEFATGMGWEWLREEGPADDVHEGGGGVGCGAGGGDGGDAIGKVDPGRGEGGFARVVGTLAAYTPATADIGRRLMVRCTPLGAKGRRGRPVVRVLTSPVRPGCEPGPLALRRRWLDDRGDGTETAGEEGRGGGGGGRVVGGERGGAGSGTEACGQGKLGGAGRENGRPVVASRKARLLRVMCYNILADMYCTSEQADKVLYPHCPKEYRIMDYRMQMVTREVRGHGADLIMLQECEAKVFDRFLAPSLAFDGFEGIYLNKAGQAQEGEAIFYRRSVLTLESSHDFSMKDAIPALEEFRGLLEAFPVLSTIVEEHLTTVAQVAVFRPSSPPSPSPSLASSLSCGRKSKEGVFGVAGERKGEEEEEKEKGQDGDDDEGSPVRLIVANTHLYFHPNAAHIRLMQLVALVERITRVRADLIAKGLTPVVILGGDLNSPPFGPVRYLMGELIGPDSDLWSTVETFKWGDRFFDETSAAAGTAALSKKGGDVPTASPGSNTAGDASEPVVSPTTTTTTKRRFLQGVPYLRVPLGLELASGTPPFTNFTPDFTETLDYVFIEGGKKAGAQADPGSSNGSPARAVEEGFLAVEGVGKDRGGKGVDTAAAAIAPMPEEGPLRAITPGLPSEAFPSDHISLVVDLVLST
ncbi:unnamed protein product [Pylaiella littoralis]